MENEGLMADVGSLDSEKPMGRIGQVANMTIKSPNWWVVDIQTQKARIRLHIQHGKLKNIEQTEIIEV